MIPAFLSRFFAMTAVVSALFAVNIPAAQAQSATATVSTNNIRSETDSALSETNLAPAEAQTELIQKLLNRIEQLEERNAQRDQTVEAIQKAHDTQVESFVDRIRELEEKVGSLEAGRVLPEITLSADDGPTAYEVDQKLRIAERRAELAAEAAEAKIKDAPRLSVSQNGISFSSGDTNFVLKLRGLVQVDSRTFFDDNRLLRGNSGFLLRRARPIIEGTFARDFDYQIVPEFGGSSVQLIDANLNYRLLPELQFRLGKFKSPVGLEQLLPDAGLPFNERSLASGLVPNRVVGFQIWGDLADGALTYAAGVFNGSADGRSAAHADFSDDKEFAGRLFARPFKRTDLSVLQGLGIGLAGSYSKVNSNSVALPSSTGGTLPGYATEGQQQFFAYNPIIGPVVAEGKHWRLSPQLSYTFGPFGLLAEYTISEQGVQNSASGLRADLRHKAWQVAGQWVLTGEPASFSGITPNRPFQIRGGGGWGAWQLVARYSQLDIDDQAFLGFSNPDTSASAATAWSVGINWWLNKNVRVLTSFTHTKFDGGGSAFNPLDPSTGISPATVTAQDENALFTRVQLSF